MSILLEALKNLEIALHHHDARTNISKLQKLLHPKFTEIGYSGNTYDFNSIVESLLSEPPPDHEVWSQDYTYEVYTPDIVQVMYLSAQLGKDGKLSRHAKRTSIWVNEAGQWQVRFHQATPVAPFERTGA